MDTNKMAQNIKRDLQIPPSYLRDFIPEMEKIELVYMDKLNEDVKHSSSASKKPLIYLEETMINSHVLDLTGSPLKVDLKGDETLVIEKDERGQQWSVSENMHYPMEIKKARAYLNSNARKKEAIFVVCDGKNPLKTVILGIQESKYKIFTCTINILGLLPMNDKELSISAMEHSHYLLTGIKGCVIKYFITFRCFIYGTFLQNIKTYTKCYGSVCIESTTTSKCDLDKPLNLDRKIKLILQVSAGHKESSVYFLWDELTLLQKYIDIASLKNIDGQTEICDDHLSIEDIITKIQQIIANTNLVQRQLKIEFCLDNIRPINMIDELWNVLKYCKNLDALRNVFHFFFEELAYNSNTNKILGNNSKMATLINGIIDGKLAVPTINYIRALELLFEIGTEKMKSDYQAISKHFYSSLCDEISNKWNQLQNKLDVDTNPRKTRITEFMKHNQIDIKSWKSELNYLGQLHVAIEFIYLVEKEAFLSKSSFDYFCSIIYDKYTKDSHKLQFEELILTPLCEFDLVINANEGDIVKGRLPDFCSVKLGSIVDNVEVETVYVLSKYSIIPPTIYDDFVIEDITQMCYYAYKMESHNETI